MRTNLIDTLIDNSYRTAGHDHIGMPYYELDEYKLANQIIRECVRVVDYENAERIYALFNTKE